MSWLLVYLPAAVMSKYGDVIPLIQIAYVGTNPTIYCNSSTKPEWFKDGIKMDVKGNPFLVVLRDVQCNESGEYTCWGMLGDGRENFTSHSNLMVGST